MTEAADYASLLLYVAAAVTVVLALLGLSALLGPRTRGRATAEPFESGVVPVGTARVRLSAKFYLIALFFVIFELEAVYLFAWAITVRESGWAGFIEAVIFIIILLAALIYLWRLGALDWAPQGRYRRVAGRRVVP